MGSIWKRIRYRLEWAGLLTAAKLVPLLSRKGCDRLALALGELMSILRRFEVDESVRSLSTKIFRDFAPHQEEPIHFARQN